GSTQRRELRGVGRVECDVTRNETISQDEAVSSIQGDVGLVCRNVLDKVRGVRESTVHGGNNGTTSRVDLMEHTEVQCAGKGRLDEGENLVHNLKLAVLVS